MTNSLSLFHAMSQDVQPLNGLENWILVNMWLTHEKQKKIWWGFQWSCGKRTKVTENILMSWITFAVFYLNKQFMNKRRNLFLILYTITRMKSKTFECPLTLHLELPSAAYLSNSLIVYLMSMSAKLMKFSTVSAARCVWCKLLWHRVSMLEGKTK